MNEQENGSGAGSILPLVIAFVVVIAAAALFQMYAGQRGGDGGGTRCPQNIKECAIALQVYWNDYDGHLPSSALVSHSKKWNKADFRTFSSIAGALPPTARPMTWSQVLFNSMRNKDIMFCGQDVADRCDPHAQVSHWYKLAIDKAWYGEQCAKPCRRRNDFPYIADQIVFYERCGFHTGAKRGLRNNVQVFAAYLDSHVKMITLTNSLPADGNRWTTSPVALGEPAYFNYDNKTNTRMSPNTLANHVDPARFSDSL